MSVTPVLKALYQLHRTQILLHAKDNDGQYQFPDAFLYAVAHHVYPMWHQSWDDDDNDPFESLYHTKKEFIEDVMEYVDNLWHQQKTIPSFYQLEEKYGRECRISLIHSFRYCYLNGGFDEKFFSQLLDHQNYPVEASGICKPFNDDELSIL